MTPLNNSTHVSINNITNDWTIAVNSDADFNQTICVQCENVDQTITQEVQFVVSTPGAPADDTSTTVIVIVLLVLFFAVAAYFCHLKFKTEGKTREETIEKQNQQNGY